MYNRSRSYSSSSRSSQNMRLWAIFGISALAVGCILIAKHENGADRARKPEVIERILEASYERCNLTNDFNDASYEHRFRRTLGEAYTVDLEAIERAGIQICLDERLNDQHVAFLDSRVTGITILRMMVSPLCQNRG